MLHLRLLTLMMIFEVIFATNILTCEKSDDIDLRNHKAYMTYAWTGGRVNYTVENAFDRNISTFIVTYFGNNYPIPPQFLDNGFNWVMVELDKQKFQMVDSVTLVLRNDVSPPWLKRIQDIEVLISNKIDYTPTMYTAVVAGKISWNNFVSCGTTGSASGDVTVDCSQRIMNSNYVAVRRNSEYGNSPHNHCCFDFAEFKVNLAVQLDQPRAVSVQWMKVSHITSKLLINCVLPSFLKIKWRKEEAVWVELGHSTILTISSGTEENVGTYYYEVFNAHNMELIFKSVSTEVVIQNSLPMCNTLCVALFSSAVVVLVIALISGAVWVVKYIRQIKSNSDAQEGRTESGQMEYLNCKNIIDASNNPVVVVEYENVSEHLELNSTGVQQMIDVNIGISDLYEDLNDVVNSTDLHASDGHLEIINNNVPSYSRRKAMVLEI